MSEDATPTPEPTPTPTSAGDVYTGPAPTEDEKSTAALSHYLNFIWLVPLILYLTKKDTSPFIKYEAGKSLNFTLTALIASFILGITVFCSPLALVIIIVQVVYGIINGGKVKKGEPTKYPWAINIVK